LNGKESLVGDFDWKPCKLGWTTATWHAETTSGMFKVDLYAGPDSDGCECEDCEDHGPDCAHEVAVVSCEVWLAGVILAQTGVGQTGFEGGVPGRDVNEQAAVLVREMTAEARATLRKLTTLAAGHRAPGTACLDDADVTRACRHLPAIPALGLMPGVEIGGVQVTTWRENGALRVGVQPGGADPAAWELDEGRLVVHVTVPGEMDRRVACELPAARTERAGPGGHDVP
jgi:hypothetical protein